MREREYLDQLCNTGDGAFIVDGDKHIVRWNKSAEKILKYSEADVLNRDCYRVIAGRTSPDKPWCGQNCKMHAAALKGTPHKNFDLLTHTNAGEPMWLNVSIVSSNSDDPLVTHIFRDVTRERKKELALDQFLADLGNPNRLPEESAKEKPPDRLGAARYLGADNAQITLSGREIEVLKLLAEGLSTKSLAEKLEISHFTARNHIQNILVKLNLHSKAQAVSYAFKNGIL